MVAGLEIYNTHGTVQINSTSLALGFHSMMTPTGWSAIGGFYIDFYPSEYTVLAVHIGSPSTFTFRQHMGGGLWRYFFAGPTAVVPVDIYRFEPMGVPTAKVGLQVFNGAGQCCFDSAQKPALVVGIVGPVAGTMVVPPGKKYACITVSRGGGVSYQRFTDDIRWYQQATTTQSRFQFSPGYFNYNPNFTLPPLSAVIDPNIPQPSNVTFPPGVYYVIDVTGY